MTARSHNSWRLIAIAAALAILLAVFLRTAWVSDDAYITFRVVDQFLHGHGPRWNLAERVQPYSHPLWFLLLSLVTAVVREPYYAAIGLSLVCALSGAALLSGAVRRLPLATTGLGVALLLSSNAFIDFSSSGLENPLTTLLLSMFFVVWWRAADRGDRYEDTRALVLVGSLLFINRTDAALLILPAIVIRLAALPWRQALRAVCIGGVPVLAWESFSLFYYGFPFPNTAYAKLTTGVPLADLATQGLAYYRDSLRVDPATLAVVAAALVVAVCTRPRRDWTIAFGLVAYLIYVLRIGGDFMSGRFFVAPFVVAVAVLIDRARRWPAPIVLAAAVVVIAVGVRAPRIAALSGANYEVAGWPKGIADERGIWYQMTGLMRREKTWLPPVTNTPRKMPNDAKALRMIAAGRTIAVQDTIGMYGYQAPLTLHIVDVLGLADPFLSKLPCLSWRIGHFYRPPPEGYLDTLESGTNQIKDPNLARYYDDIALVTRGPLVSRARLAAIIRLNFGVDNHLLPTSAPYGGP
jgi:arabinofuranosyltransferase